MSIPIPARKIEAFYVDVEQRLAAEKARQEQWYTADEPSIPHWADVCFIQYLFPKPNNWRDQLRDELDNIFPSNFGIAVVEFDQESINEWRPSVNVHRKTNEFLPINHAEIDVVWEYAPATTVSCVIFIYRYATTEQKDACMFTHLVTKGD